MKPAPFVLPRAPTVDEALAVLAEVGHDGKVLAGGQSLMPILNMRLASPAHLVDINQRRRARVRHRRGHRGAGRRAGPPRPGGADARRPPRSRCCARRCARRAPVIRNRGTTVGSIVHADPAGEMPAVLACSRAWSRSPAPRAAGDRRRPTSSSARSSRRCRRTSWPSRRGSGASPAGTGTAFVEVARRHGDYAICGVAAAVTIGPTGSIGDGARRVREGHRRAASSSTSPSFAGQDADGSRLVRGRRRSKGDRPGGRHPRDRRLPRHARGRAHRLTGRRRCANRATGRRLGEPRRPAA